MSCSKCGAAVTTVDSTGGIESGEFVEKHECANGHQGYITGEASDQPNHWDRYGQVFNE